MANEKISFFDSEKDILIEAYVSPGEAQRAVTDIAFAAELYERVITQNSESSSFNNVNENNVNTETLDIEKSNNTGDLTFESQEDNGGNFCQKGMVQPVAVASSTGLLSKQDERNNSISDSDSGCSLRSRKPTITSLLAKRLKQKEEHEQNKSKRHKERIDMDKKLLAVLEKLADK
ncbi:hypothetical protein K1T71_003938 [Dendrolimus kikuchii]|uniref:Uncharacterized protein n=1 Tax=Dendrolimus kikuchii TaxID=765133 RepID=A0ACC1D9T9_9NEOP|nr:hypothetical protein K1T71_003938 [Dendrolimus kikuchii]